MCPHLSPSFDITIQLKARNMGRPRTIAIKIRLYPGADDDLIAWYNAMDAETYGARTQAIKSAWRRGLAGSPPAAAAPILALAQIRQVVEAAVNQSLSRFSGVVLPAAAEPDDETEDLLADFERNLVLDD